MDTDELAIDLRCPAGYLLGRTIAPKIVEGNLVELDCRKCRKNDHPEARRVLHRFNVLGDCVETVVVP